MTHRSQTVAGFVLALTFACAAGAQTTPPAAARQSVDARSHNSPQPSAWESSAHLYRAMRRSTPGKLRTDAQGIEFVPVKGRSKRWSFAEISNLDLGRHRMILTGYEDRSWRVPGEQQFKFTFGKEMTPAVAASLAEEVSEPVRNRIPDPHAPAVEVIGVRRGDHFGGTNGFLRIRLHGIDYVTARPGQSRSWRWADLQTVSNPDPYHLFVFGYRDNFAFDLKQRLPREMFNELSDEIWTNSQSATRSGPVALPPILPKDGERREDD